jgi:hypothetical protein
VTKRELGRGVCEIDLSRSAETEPRGYGAIKLKGLAGRAGRRRPANGRGDAIDWLLATVDDALNPPDWTAFNRALAETSPGR